MSQLLSLFPNSALLPNFSAAANDLVNFPCGKSPHILDDLSVSLLGRDFHFRSCDDVDSSAGALNMRALSNFDPVCHIVLLGNINLIQSSPPR